MSRPRAAASRRLPPNLYRRADGRYYFRDPRSGKTFGLGRDLAAAVAQAAEVNVQLAQLRARARLTHRVAGGGGTLGDWLDEHGKALDADTGLSEGTRKVYRSLTALLRGALGDRVLGELLPADVAAALRPWTAAGKGQQAWALLQHLRRALAAAAAAGQIPVDYDPTRGLRVRRTAPKRQRLTLDDFLKLHEAAAGREPWVRRWLELGLLTTLRGGDLLGLHWRRATPEVTGWIEDEQLRVVTGKRGHKIAIPLGLGLPVAGAWTVESVLAAIRADGVASQRLLRRSWRRPGVRVGAGIKLGTAEAVFGDLVAAAGIVVEEGKTRPTPHELRSLGLRLHRAAHGREWARHLGTHTDEATADGYADPRGSEWVVIPLPSPAAVDDLADDVDEDAEGF